jgi:hypothetical protein
MDVVAVDDDVGEIDTDAKRDPLIDGHIGVAVSHVLLHLDGASHGIDDAGEFNEYSVAGRLHNPPVVLGNLRAISSRADPSALRMRRFSQCRQQSILTLSLRSRRRTAGTRSEA